MAPQILANDWLHYMQKNIAARRLAAIVDVSPLGALARRGLLDRIAYL